MPFTVFNVVAARPNFPKVAPLHRVMSQSAAFRPVLVHTGQHYDYPMSDAFLHDLGLPAPDHHLEVGSGNHGEQTGEALKRFEKLLLEKKPDLVLVVGDVNSTLACALAAAKLDIPVAHIESGLRSFDRRMPEEINRIVTDSLSELLFVTEEIGRTHLLREGYAREAIHLCGDVMIDAVMQVLEKAKALDKPKSLGLTRAKYAVLTMHRPANVDDPVRLTRLLDGIERVARILPVVFPVHPRTSKRFDELGLRARVEKLPGLILSPPLGYVEFLSLVESAAFAVTDSGGLPEECTLLGIHCLTMRDTTERPQTIEHGINHLVDDDIVKMEELARLLSVSGAIRLRAPRGWDGHAAERIVAVIEKFLRQRAEGKPGPRHAEARFATRAKRVDAKKPAKSAATRASKKHAKKAAKKAKAKK